MVAACVAASTVRVSHYFRGILIGTAIVLAMALLTACGNIDTPLPVTPHCPPDVVSNPQPVYPAN